MTKKYLPVYLPVIYNILLITWIGWMDIWDWAGIHFFFIKAFWFFLGVHQRTKSFSRSIWTYRGEMGDAEISAEVMAFFHHRKITAHLSTLYSRDNAWKENGGLLFRSDMPNVMMYCCMIKSLIQISVVFIEKLLKNSCRTENATVDCIYFLLSSIFH